MDSSGITSVGTGPTFAAGSNWAWRVAWLGELLACLFVIHIQGRDAQASWLLRKQAALCLQSKVLVLWEEEARGWMVYSSSS